MFEATCASPFGASALVWIGSREPDFTLAGSGLVCRNEPVFFVKARSPLSCLRPLPRFPIYSVGLDQFRANALADDQ
jgi:hypothetical protein